MDSSGFSSPRPDCFPAGLRVLVVDDDPTWLKILEKMLKKCNYEGPPFYKFSFFVCQDLLKCDCPFCFFVQLFCLCGCFLVKIVLYGCVDRYVDCDCVWLSVCVLSWGIALLVVVLYV